MLLGSNPSALSAWGRVVFENESDSRLNIILQ
jgi:hypothetical protein